MTALRLVEDVPPVSQLEDLAALANAKHRAFEQTATAAVALAVEAGQALLAAKAVVPHGSWGRWLADHFDGSERSAQDYMKVARYPQHAAGASSLRSALAAVADPVKERKSERAARVARTQARWRQLERTIANRGSEPPTRGVDYCADMIRAHARWLGGGPAAQLRRSWSDALVRALRVLSAVPPEEHERAWRFVIAEQLEVAAAELRRAAAGVSA